MDAIINVPLMPSPEDFGVSPRDWQHEGMTEGDDAASGARVRAYKQVLEVWKEVGKALASQPK